MIGLAGYIVSFAYMTGDGVRNAIAHQAGEKGHSLLAVWTAALRIVAFLAAASTILFTVAACRFPENVSLRYVAVAFGFLLFAQAAGIVYLLKDEVEKNNLQNALTSGGGTSIVTLIAVIVFHASLATAMSIWVCGYVACALLAGLGLPALLGSGTAAFDWNLLRGQIAFGMKSALQNNVAFLALRIDIFIVSALASPAALGVYTLGVATGEILMTISRTVLMSTTGRIATLETAEAARLTARGVRSLVALCLVCSIGLFIAGPWLIVVVYGKAFAGSGDVLRFLLPGIVFYSADGLLSYYVAVRAGRPGLLLGLESATAILCGVATYIGLKTIGLPGAALADSIAYVAAFAAKAWYFSKYSGLSARDIVVIRRADLPGALLRLGRTPLE